MSLTGNNVLGSSGYRTNQPPYEIDQSVRFDDGDSACLSRTPSAGDRKTWTWSGWIKRSDDGFGILFGAGDTEDIWNSSSMTSLTWANGGDSFQFYSDGTIIRKTTQLFRDFSAWGHLVLAVDTTISSPAGDRTKVYWNGAEITDFSTSNDLSEDELTYVNHTINHVIGGQQTDVANSYYDGYLAEVNFIDGQQLTPSSFGDTDSTTNQWKPIEYTGSYGTNGFYQKYANTELANSFTDSAEGYYIAINGNVHTDTSVKKIGTASAQFDGTGDYLSIANSSDFKLGSTSDSWTIEFWVYFDDVSSDHIIMDHRANTQGDGGFSFYSDVSAGGVGFDRSNGSAWSAGLQDPTQNVTGQWYHYAVVQVGDTSLKMYADGTEVDTTATLMDDDSGTYVNWFIGGGYNNGGSHSNNYYLNGYLDEIRVSDVARYTGSFTPSTTAFTTDANTKLLLHCDGSNGGTTFTDSSGYTGPRHAITANGNVANTRAQSKIGDSSIVFDGTGDYLTVPDSTDWDVFESGSVFTLEAWIKFSSTPTSSDYNDWFCQQEDSSNGWRFGFDASTPGYSSIWMWMKSGGSTVVDLIGGRNGTTDAGQITDTDWHHVAMVKNGSQYYGYVDGVECIDATDTDSDTFAAVLGVGGFSVTPAANLNGYMDEIRISDNVRYPDGTTFTPSTTQFTADSNTLLLIHSDFDGGLGADSSGNENDFAATNLVATDQMEDSPTNNFCTYNPIASPDAAVTFSEGNLETTSSTAEAEVAHGTIEVSGGKWYWETYVDSVTAGGCMIGAKSSQYAYDHDSSTLASTNGYGYYTTGNKYNTSSAASYGDTFTAGDIIGVALDMGGKIWFSKNGVWQASGDPAAGSNAAFDDLATSTDAPYPLVPSISNGGATSANTSITNFGQDSSFAGNKTAQGNQDDNEIGDFYYDVPAGFLALCTSNLSAPEIADPTENFNTVLYTGNQTTNAITGVGFQPDWLWVKNRTTSGDYPVMVDAVRGRTEVISSASTSAEWTDSTAVTSFDSDGFTLGNATTDWNRTGGSFVAWDWKGGGTGVTNTDGAISTTVTVSANTTAGFSIVSWEGIGTATTVGHGLSQAPELIIVKRLDDVNDWLVGSTPVGWTKIINLNAALVAETGSSFWNDTAPTSTVFTVGTNAAANASGSPLIGYVFHSVEGYSKIGSYEGNGDADGTFVYTGFSPSFCLFKNVDSAVGWAIFDNKRPGYNVIPNRLFPDESSAEATSSGNQIDFLGNGLKIRSTGSTLNSAETYLYMAFAETPFKTANAR